MPRNMSFMLTTDQIKNKTKTVTRRLGWQNLKVGSILNACEKCQGLKKGEKVNILCRIMVTSVRRERLSEITPEDIVREGFPQWADSPFQFKDMFCRANACGETTEVTRIEFEYI